MPMISSHKDLAKAIQGKKILHLNSMGKDAVLCLEWLQNYAKVETVSLFFELKAAKHPDDDRYWEYLKRRYPRVKFVKTIDVAEMSEVLGGMFQSPTFINYVINNQEFYEFSMGKVAEEYRLKFGCDYICRGVSCYEGMGRALYLRRQGLLDEKRKLIHPIGLMKQAQVIGALKGSGVKLHPSYRTADSSYDSASYFKMRAGFVAKPEFKKTVYAGYPLLALDEYRYEVMYEIRKGTGRKTSPKNVKRHGKVAKHPKKVDGSKGIP